MSAADPDPDDMLAAECALGTLDGAEQQAAMARMAQDPDFAGRVAEWDRRLAPLIEAVRDVEPPERLWPSIAGRVGLSAVGPTRMGPNASGDRGARVVFLERGLRRWRRTAGAMTALAACLAVALAVASVELRRSPSPSLVAVLQRADNPPAYLVKANLPDRSMSVQAVNAAVPTGHSYELWLVDPSAGAPRSLGLLDAAVSRHALPAGLSPDVLSRATYAVTEEPPGGSPTGAPSGTPVYTGHLAALMP